MIRPTPTTIATLAMVAGGLLLAGTAAPAAADLVAHYPFDGNADDASGYANHGVPNDTATLTTDRFGTPDAAYYFNGIDARITIPGSTSLDQADSAVTMAAWMQLDGWSLVGQAYGPILMKSDQGGNAFMYRLAASQVGLGLAISNWNQAAVSPTDFEFDRWYHVAGTWDGAEARFYVDGLLLSAEPLAVAPAAPDGRPLVIGADVPGILEVFQGKLDDVRVYDRALSGPEIADLAGTSTDVGALPAAPTLAITSTAPNPFNPTTAIRYRLRATDHLSLRVYDGRGRLVRTLVDSTHPAGEHTAVWDGRDGRGRSVGSGVYIARLEGAGQVVSRKLVLAK
jgi:hypothetical protein